MDFKTLLASILEMQADERPEDFLAQLDAAYDADLGSADARVGESDGRIQELEAEVSRLKSHNYDLLMQVRAQDVTDDPDPDDDPDDDPTGDDPDAGGIADLFEEEK